MGNELFKSVTELTGLPENEITPELEKALGAIGASPESMSIEDLRDAVTQYLIEIFEKNTGKN